MQEDIERRTVAVSVTAAKLTGRVLAKALMAAARQIQKKHRAAQTPHGRQSAKKLMNHGVATSTIPLDGDTRLFDRVARKWNVDYSFHKTGPKKYLLLFKARQADAITACFSEYTKRVMAKTKDRRLPIREQLKQAGDMEKTRPRQRERTREAVHGDR